MEDLKLDEIYKKYKAEYNHIFDYINPVYHAERFTEENQTINFCNALKEVYGKDNVYVWLEYPWKIDGVTFGNTKNSSCRFDAIVFIKNQDTDKGNLFVIESKCLRSESKYIAINNDFCRILGHRINDNDELEQFTNNKLKEKKLIEIHIPEDKIDNVYAVILADYWQKPRAKKYCDIHSRWKYDKHSTTRDLFDNFKTTINTTKNKKIINQPHFKSLEITIEKNQTKKQYYLLTMIAMINNPESIYHFIQE